MVFCRGCGKEIHESAVPGPATDKRILQIVTLGSLGIWTFVDLILIIIGSFTDADGKKITLWT